jgi:hypothetical protein
MMTEQEAWITPSEFVTIVKKLTGEAVPKTKIAELARRLLGGAAKMTRGQGSFTRFSTIDVALLLMALALRNLGVPIPDCHTCVCAIRNSWDGIRAAYTGPMLDPSHAGSDAAFIEWAQNESRFDCLIAGVGPDGKFTAKVCAGDAADMDYFTDALVPQPVIRYELPLTISRLILGIYECIPKPSPDQIERVLSIYDQLLQDTEVFSEREQAVVRDLLNKGRERMLGTAAGE